MSIVMNANSSHEETQYLLRPRFDAAEIADLRQPRSKLDAHDDDDTQPQPLKLPLGAGQEDMVDPASPTVLIIDDDPAARLTLCGLLWSEGYRIAFATSADDARERLAEIQPDVILCDLIMQGTNGDQFCAWLKAHGIWRYVPVIAITCVNNTVATAAMLESGADDVIVKPVKARELQARVGAALRTRDRYLDLVRQPVPAIRQS